MSKAIILAGGTGCGKTFYTRNTLLKNVNKKSLLIFDTNNEYSDLYPEKFNPDIDAFLSKCLTVKNAVILIEDATSFISNRGRSDKLVKLLVAKRHTKNTFILLFHSLRAVPKYLIDISTHLGIFKTNDDLGFIKNEFKNERILKAFYSVQKDAEKNNFYKKYPPPPKTVPSFLVISLY